MNRVIDMTGQRFGRWTVLERAKNNKYNQAMWLSRCDCGTETIVLGHSLRYGSSTCCRYCSMKGKKYPKHSERMKGKNNPFFGKHHSDEVKLKISKSHKGRKHSDATKIKMSEVMRGENNPNYNHNITDEERQIGRFYPEYYEWRTAVYERDNYTCQLCGSKKSGTLNAHHLNSYTTNPKLRTTTENGITLCETCHKDFHHQYGYRNNTEEQWLTFQTKIN